MNLCSLVSYLSHISSSSMRYKVKRHTSTSFRFSRSSSSLSRSLTISAVRSADSSLTTRASDLVLARSSATSSSAFFSRVCSAPRERNASARSRRSCAISGSDVVWEASPADGGGSRDFLLDLGVSGLGVAAAAAARAARTSFSASRAATRSAN